MFYPDYNSEASIKKWAKILQYIAYIFMGLSVLASFILFCIDIDSLGLIGLIIVLGGVITCFSIIFLSHLVWGFGELVGNSKRMCDPTARKEQTSSIAPRSGSFGILPRQAEKTEKMSGVCELCHTQSDSLTEIKIENEMGTFYRKACPSCMTKEQK